MAFIMLNCAKPPTNDLTIRQALAKGLDQATIQKIFGGGFAQPVSGLFLEGSPYYSRHRLPVLRPVRPPSSWWPSTRPSTARPALEL